MKEKVVIFLLLIVACFDSKAEIVNYRKTKAKQEPTFHVPAIETNKNNAISQTQQLSIESIPKPNSPVLEKEKIVIPLMPPSDPPKPQAKQPSQFARPFNQKLITTVNFSLNPENPHKGVVYSPLDIGSVLSSMEGIVVAIDYMDGYYNYIIIEHPNGFFTVYGNLDEVYVAEGQTIKKGEVLGNLVKEKGLYFQVNQGKKILDPISLIKS